ncbi:hypothetical protein [Sporosarcina pasteurii]|uniref:Uncharacterized protein n=1 Tax=Sporosarcina pasteurii TaxID=1474 RepID=A0A380BLK7_SPOPA|nr:hypothetical protein [Sporosarcina pasteurii]MDS9470931.1 hypothetical protein [Sporosarcina pasteurii]QBQ05414.1 hypothetical protein E2C16_06900 [Sporosarcina pasteurii]SUJ03326.1 Uncharacterised protein [Sporosarcina pasteurii]
MDGQILANSLVTLKGTDLRMVYALLIRTNIGHLLSSKTKDVISKLSKEESDNFTYHLEQEVNKLKNVEDQVLQVDLFLEMTRLLNLRGTKYTLEQEIVDQSTIIVNDVYQQLLKQDKQFKSFAVNELNSTKLQQMVQFQMSKLFNELDNSFKDFTIDDQTKFASQVNEYIQSLPKEKQKQIKDKLGIDELTDEMIRKAIATSGSSIVFAIIVEVSGFAFYTTATSLLASFAGLFGITLPFGVYTGLTSTIAVLANPLFIVPVLLGGGVLLVNHQNKSLKKKLLPIIVMQMTLPFMSQESEEVSYELFISVWNRRFNEYCKLQVEFKNENAEELNLQSNIKKTKDRISNINSSIYNEELQIRAEKQKIYFALKSSNLEDLEINVAFQMNRREYWDINNKIQSFRQAKKVDAVNDSFLRRIGNKFSNLTTILDIKSEEKKLDKYLYLMVEDVIKSTSSFKQIERATIKAININLKELHQSKHEEISYKNSLESSLKQVKQSQSSIWQDIKMMEKQNYGLEHLSASTHQLLPMSKEG